MVDRTMIFSDWTLGRGSSAPGAATAAKASPSTARMRRVIRRSMRYSPDEDTPNASRAENAPARSLVKPPIGSRREHAALPDGLGGPRARCPGLGRRARADAV